LDVPESIHLEKETYDDITNSDGKIQLITNALKISLTLAE
jgi:hypothetical protein